MRLLGATPARSWATLGGWAPWTALVTNDPGERSERIVYRGSCGKDCSHVRLEDDDVAPDHSIGVGVPATLAEVILR